MPTGFRQISDHQRDYQSYLRPHKQLQSTPTNLVSSISDTNAESSSLDLFTPTSTSYDDVSTTDIDTGNTQSSLQPVLLPTIRSVDKPSSSISNIITVSEDFLRASMGFRRVDTVKKHFSTLYKDTLKLDNTPVDAILDPGDLATLHKKARNTTPTPRPAHFGDVMHMDIVFGPEVAIGNVHFGLMFSDRHSRMTYIYPLHNLTHDIPKQIEAFFAHLGFVPHRLITDFDLKLIGGRAREYLNSLLVHVNAAPANRQDKNGLVERHWQTMVSMARNWLASAELPSSFWFFAVRRAAEVCNYFPYKLEDGTYSTPFKLAHRQKPDLQVLFKMFGLAAVRRERVGDSNLNKFDAQSLPMIAVG